MRPAVHQHERYNVVNVFCGHTCLAFQEWKQQSEMEEDAVEGNALWKCIHCRGARAEETKELSANNILDAILSLIQRWKSIQSNWGVEWIKIR